MIVFPSSHFLPLIKKYRCTSVLNTWLFLFSTIIFKLCEYHFVFPYIWSEALYPAKLDGAKTKPSVFAWLCKVPIIVCNKISVATYCTKYLPKYSWKDRGRWNRINKLIATLVFSQVCLGHCYTFGYFLWGRQVKIACLAERGYSTHRTRPPPQLSEFNHTGRD